MTATIDRGKATEPVTQIPSRPRRSRRRVSSNSLKAVMAVSGAVLVLFLVAHMAGNLKIFAGAESFNGYAAWLREVGYPLLPHRGLLTLLEAGLVVAIAAHMYSAIVLARRAANARPVKYAAKVRSRANGYATRTMRWGGVIIFFFVIYHLLDMTFGVANPEGHEATPFDRMVAGFDPSRWYITVFYVISVVMVGLHLRHGLWSALQTLGLARRYPVLKASAAGLSALLTLGFLVVPLAITFGVVR